MTKRNKTSTAAPKPAPPANGKPADEAVIVPEVTTLPPAVARLTWLEKLILADDFLRHPRRFLAQTTHSEKEAREDLQLKPKADHKVQPYHELRQVLDAFVPDSPTVINNRRIQTMFVRSRLGELPDDELKTGVSRLINTLMPFGAGDRADKDAWGDAEWSRRKKLHWENTAEVIAEIDSEIRNRLANGERDDRLVVTSDLGSANKTLSLHSEAELFWDIHRPLRLSALLYENLPDNSPLRKLNRERLPRLNRDGGPSLVILGPAVPSTILAAPRPYYFLATVEALTRFGWSVWAERHKSYLQHRDTAEEFERFQKFEELLRKPHPTVWSYPEAPAVPPLTGFASRSLFCVDIIGHLGRYIARPTTNRSLSDLLAARRVLVDDEADQDQRTNLYAARRWVGRWYETNKREDLAEALWALAKTTMQTVEDLEIAYRDHSLAEYQRVHVLKEDK